DKRRYLWHFTILMSGTAFGQLINFAAYPLLTRTYSPHDFGIFTVFVATASTIGAVACGRFDVTVQVAANSEKFTTHALSQVINAGVSLCATLAAFAYWALRGGDFTPVVAALLGLSVFLTGYGNASSLLLLKGEHYKLNSLATLLRTLITVVSQLALFWL